MQKQIAYSTEIFVTTRFEGFHRWKDAPADVSFLRFMHRHLFGVTLGVWVTHNDRDVEFFQLKRKLEEHIKELWEGRKFDYSCEAIAEMLICYITDQGYSVSFCTVDEDGENGATLHVKDQTNA